MVWYPPQERKRGSAFDQWMEQWGTPEKVQEWEDLLSGKSPTDAAVMQKQADDAAKDADTSGHDEAKGASPAEVSRVRQARGPRGRSDQRVPSATSGKNSHEYLENPELWNKTRKL